MSTWRLKELIGNGLLVEALEYLEYWYNHTTVFKATYKAYMDMVKGMMVA